jgi:LPS-assembly lipoprotein
MNRTAFMLRLARPLSALLLLLPMTVGGCGFKPLYGEQDGQTNISAEMKEIYVDNIPERLGQQVRLALQESMAQDGPEDPHKYRLQVSPQVSAEAIDIHNDNTTGRQRLVGRAHWVLFSVEATPRLLAQGDTTTMDGFTSTYEQYFALTLNSETAYGRVAQTLASQITQQVATWLRTGSNPLTQQPQGPKTYYPIPTAIPNSNNETPMDVGGDDAIPAMATGRSSGTNDSAP